MNRINCYKIIFLLTVSMVMAFFYSNCALTMEKGRMVEDKKMKKTLTFKIQPTSKKFSFAEPIIIKGIIKNISDRSLYVNKTFCLTGNKVENKGYGIALCIINPKNEKVEFRILYEIISPTKDWFIKLEPGKSFSDIIKLDISEFSKEKGIFKIAAFYYNFIGDEFNIPEVWKGIIESNTIEIQIS